MATRTGTLPASGGQADPKQVPWGWLGWVDKTAGQSSITAAVDISGLSLTVTVGTLRRVRVSWDVRYSASGGGMSIRTRCMEGATQLRSSEVQVSSNLFGLTSSGAVILTPTAGSHTYKLQAEGNAGTAALVASASDPSWLLVEDLGPSA